MSIRLRLTLLYSAILAFTLILFSSALYVIQSKVTFDDARGTLVHQAFDLANGQRRLPPRAESAAPAGPLPGRWSQMRASDGTVLTKSPDLGDTDLPLSAAGLRAAQNGESWAEEAVVDGDSLLIVSVPFATQSGSQRIMQAAAPTEGRDQSLATLRWILFLGSSLVILAAFVIGWVLAGTALEPIHRITQTAQAIGADRNFSRRVDHTGPNDEIGQLATTFNAMLTELGIAYRQVEQALHTQRRFVADASHELRTPLTTVRGNIELLRHEPPLEAREQADILSDAKEEVERLIRLVNQLLVLARADAGRPLRCETLPLQTLVEEVYRQARLLAPQRTIECQAPVAVMVCGDHDALKQVLLILLDNAIVHTPATATVTLSTVVNACDVAIRIADTGPGIPPESLAHVFERFYRGDVSRSGGGTGLGLAIARELVQAPKRIDRRREPGWAGECVYRYPALGHLILTTRYVVFKRWRYPVLLFISLALIALSGYLGYAGVALPGVSGQVSLPRAGGPTPAAETRTVAVSRSDVRQVLTVPGDVTTARQQSMGFSAGGKLVEVTVRAGDTITKGQILARLETEPLKLAVSQAQASVKAKQAALEKLKAQPTASDLAAAQAKVQAAQAGVQTAQYNLTVSQNSSSVAQTIRDREYEVSFYTNAYNEAQRKFQAGKIDQDRLNLDYYNLQTAQERLNTARTQSQITLSESNQSVASAQETLRQAQEDLAELKKGASQVDLTQAEANLQSAQANLKEAEVNLANAVLSAPFDGKVLSISALTGETVGENASFITIADLTQLEIKGTIGQEDVAQVKPGQAATVTFDALPGGTFAAKVGRVVPTKASTSGAVNYTIYVTLDKVPEGLLPGMTADADLIVAEHKNVLTLPRRTLRGKTGSTVSLGVLQDGQVITKSVKIGLVGDLTSEIASGLDEGDRVVTSQ